MLGKLVHHRQIPLSWEYILAASVLASPHPLTITIIVRILTSSSRSHQLSLGQPSSVWLRRSVVSTRSHSGAACYTFSPPRRRRRQHHGVRGILDCREPDPSLFSRDNKANPFKFKIWPCDKPRFSQLMKMKWCLTNDIRSFIDRISTWALATTPSHFRSIQPQ